MTIGRVMDWTEARLDAIKAREEEEDEDEEREKERERGRPAATPTSAPTTNLVAKPDTRKATTSGTSASGERTKVTVCFFPLRKHFINNIFFFLQPPSLPTSHSPTARSIALPSERSSPSPSSTTTTLRPTQRPTRSRPHTTKGDPPNSSASQVPPFNLISESHPPTSQPFPDTPITIGAGAKRRHAMMMILDSGSTPVSIGGSSMPPPSPSGPGNINGVYSGSPNHTAGLGMNRRRTRSTRSLTHQAHQQPQNQNINMIQVASEAMDIEEDGRERKRVARR